jgi:hypothetical protein
MQGKAYYPKSDWMPYFCSTSWTLKLGDMLFCLSGQIDGIGSCSRPSKEERSHDESHSAAE